MTDIKSMTIPELEELMLLMGQPKFRAKQIFQWLHQKRVLTFDEMKNLPTSLREELSKTCTITSFSIERKLVSQIDGTTKYLYRLSDGEYVESVLMRYEHGISVCVSTQVGCKMGCSFCASTKAGFIRHLTPSEILEQVYAPSRDTGERIDSIVLMGIGEPLDNFDNVMRFLTLVSAPEGLCMSHRHISLSTCGLVDRIYELADMGLQITLSVSLHASSDAVRDEIMPVNHRYKIPELLKACQYYTDKTHRRISYEYSLIKGVNDNAGQAKELAALLHGMLCHVNLIPVNYVEEAGFEKSGKQQVYAFQKVLLDHGINATVRRTLGADINAACGQLRRTAIQK
ncbi:MAG: 23S rRNA (adenine(2503)-C(2))-methyltransferase RlmN [Candidatus Faecivivens sp.]|nr:23S rRNA (adenine(2503)-C(2))-methyltransferase RlmN [Oscillospiraceae bacterium]MDY2712069.1 23S rRNA (adenine(2503)-C(2))-methyltransferase RlmN [Candidatus Faecivivens sp.]